MEGDGRGGPLTSAEIAERSGVAERYVREWASAQAASGYLEYEPDGDTFDLPAEHALVFADEGSPVYLLGGYHIVSSAFKDRKRIADRFRTGQGFGWHEHDPELFAGTEQFFRPGYRTHLVAEWIPALEGVTDKLTAGAKVADIGCGHGVSTMLLAQAYPASTISGFDYHGASIKRAGHLAESSPNAQFDVAGAKEFEGARTTSCASSTACTTWAIRSGRCQHVREQLDEDGSVMLVEPFAADTLAENLNPVGRIYYAASTLICTPSSLDQEVGLGLGAQAGEERLARDRARGGLHALPPGDGDAVQPDLRSASVARLRLARRRRSAGGPPRPACETQSSSSTRSTGRASTARSPRTTIGRCTSSGGSPPAQARSRARRGAATACGTSCRSASRRRRGRPWPEA